MDLEDRYKLIFVGFGRFRWASSRDGNIFGWVWKIWMALSGFDWIWGGCRFVWISKLDFDGIKRFSWIIKGFGWI